LDPPLLKYARDVFLLLSNNLNIKVIVRGYRGKYRIAPRKDKKLEKTYSDFPENPKQSV